MNPRLVIFDADGTLIDRETGAWLPGVEAYFAGLPRRRPAFAIASNQGGVGCRVGFGGFGNPERYPTETEALERYLALAGRIGARLYLCFAYQARSGEWSARPTDARAPEFWRPDWRKPSAGMLVRAMRDARVSPGETLMVGDRDEDMGAAVAANVSFVWADVFFGRRREQ